MKIMTPAEAGKNPRKIKYSDKILLLGSCFSDEIGRILKDYRFDVLSNPFGTLYNPFSIFNAAQRVMSAQPFEQQDVIERPDGLYVSFMHHSCCGRNSAEEFLKSANDSLAESSAFAKEADTVIVTLGTSWVYKYAGEGQMNGMIVSNCHKLPASKFKREFMDKEKTIGMLKNIAALFPRKNLIFTVSPIRHLADGAHGNKISKASLLLAVEDIIKECKCDAPYYFPAYEIMEDELRDYRWYAEDMVHPSGAAVKYIFEKFAEACIEDDSRGRMEENHKISKRENHIPLTKKRLF